MLTLLSPAKSLNMTRQAPVAASAPPAFMSDSQLLIKALRQMSPTQLGELMNISPALAQLNAERYQAWRVKPSPDQVMPALFAFDGDVYDGLDASSLSESDLTWAQSHVRILSGLYGVLKPFDEFQAYRLEMSTRLHTSRGHNLLQFWGDRLGEHLLASLKAQTTPVVLNLASQEYFSAVAGSLGPARVINCVFEDYKTDRYKVISFFAKKARGWMARWVIQQRVDTPQALTAFAHEGYSHAPDVSTPDQLIFRRRSS